MRVSIGNWCNTRWTDWCGGGHEVANVAFGSKSILGCERRLLTYGYDCCDPSASQIDSKGRQSIYFILGGTVQDRHVVALDKACVLQALLESAQKLLNSSRSWRWTRSSASAPTRCSSA